MSLEELLKPVKAVDREVLRQYTRLGQKIPENYLYPITMGVGLIGITEICLLNFYFDLRFISVQIGVLGSFDCVHSLDGLMGKIQKDTDGETIAIDRIQSFYLNYNRGIRLPIFLTGVGFLGKAVYSIGNYVINGEPLNEMTGKDVMIGLGFLSFASSMYLKDQDPRLLKKQPSKVKAFFQGLYDGALEWLSPRPVPVKVDLW